MIAATYAAVHDWDNLYHAYLKARKGKRFREPAARFEYRLEDNLVALRRELADNNLNDNRGFRIVCSHGFHLFRKWRAATASRPRMKTGATRSRPRPILRAGHIDQARALAQCLARAMVTLENR